MDSGIKDAEQNLPELVSFYKKTYGYSLERITHLAGEVIRETDINKNGSLSAFEIMFSLFRQRLYPAYDRDQIVNDSVDIEGEFVD